MGRHLWLRPHRRRDRRSISRNGLTRFSVEPKGKGSKGKSGDIESSLPTAQKRKSEEGGGSCHNFKKGFQGPEEFVK